MTPLKVLRTAQFAKYISIVAIMVLVFATINAIAIRSFWLFTMDAIFMYFNIYSVIRMNRIIKDVRTGY